MGRTEVGFPIMRSKQVYLKLAGLNGHADFDWHALCCPGTHSTGAEHGQEFHGTSWWSHSRGTFLCVG